MTAMSTVRSAPLSAVMSSLPAVGAIPVVHALVAVAPGVKVAVHELAAASVAPQVLPDSVVPVGKPVVASARPVAVLAPVLVSVTTRAPPLAASASALTLVASVV